MKKILIILTAGVLLASCASKKQYVALQQDYTTLQRDYQTAKEQLAENRATIKSLEERFALEGRTEGG